MADSLILYVDYPESMNYEELSYSINKAHVNTYWLKMANQHLSERHFFCPVAVSSQTCF